MRIPIPLLHLSLSLLPLTTALNLPWLTLTNCHAGTPGAVYVCSNAHFTGDCMYHATSGECFAPPSAPMSIGPDKGGHCVVFQGRECEGEIIKWDAGEEGKNVITCPGVRSWSDGLPKVGSIRCHAGM